MEHRSYFAHVLRGLGTLPHSGSHPGIKVLFFIIFATAMSGIPSGGLSGFIGGLVIGCIVYVPILIMGSAARSREDDRFEHRRNARIEAALRSE